MSCVGDEEEGDCVEENRELRAMVDNCKCT